MTNNAPNETPDRSPNEILTREISLQILHTVLDKSQPLDQAFDNSNGFISMKETRDRAFIKMLVTTTIRRLGQIDNLINRALARKDQEIKPPKLYHILRLGVCQIIFMDVPDYAAVNTMVDLADKLGLSKQKSFVNALLRKVGREGLEWTTRQDIPRLNTPEWILKHWIDDYGIRNAVDIAQAMMSESCLDLTIKNKDDLKNWEQTLEGKILPTGSLRLSAGGRIDNLQGFSEGAWWVQDAAAAIPAKLFGDINGKTIADLCAAPGGKTAQLVIQGANVIALDRSARRMVRFKENLERLGVENRVKTEVADANVWVPQEPLDGVLLDAPCTASGTLRKRPDVAWLKKPADLESMITQQKRLLDNAAPMLKSGGILIYSTCSLFMDEGEKQINAFLSAHPDYSRKPITADEIGGLNDLIDKNGDLRVLPSSLATLGGMDGFYASRLVKNG